MDEKFCDPLVKMFQNNSTKREITRNLYIYMRENFFKKSVKF